MPGVTRSFENTEQEIKFVHSMVQGVTDIIKANRMAEEQLRQTGQKIIDVTRPAIEAYTPKPVLAFQDLLSRVAETPGAEMVIPPVAYLRTIHPALKSHVTTWQKQKPGFAEMLQRMERPMDVELVKHIPTEKGGPTVIGRYTEGAIEPSLAGLNPTQRDLVEILESLSPSGRQTTLAHEFPHPIAKGGRDIYKSFHQSWTTFSPKGQKRIDTFLKRRGYAIEGTQPSKFEKALESLQKAFGVESKVKFRPKKWTGARKMEELFAHAQEQYSGLLDYFKDTPEVQYWIKEAEAAGARPLPVRRK